LIHPGLGSRSWKRQNTRCHEAPGSLEVCAHLNETPIFMTTSPLSKIINQRRIGFVTEHGSRSANEETEERVNRTILHKNCKKCDGPMQDYARELMRRK
jgi:hypothetical protein